MRILFFGDGPWATESLQYLLEDGREVLGVVLRREPSDQSLVEAATRLRLPVLQPDRANAEGFVDVVRGFAPDLNLSVSYDQIIRRPLLDSAPLGFVNIHAGLLPYYRGRSVINWAIINGEEHIGITAHYVDEGIDTGDIILQRKIPVAWTDGYGDVLEKVIRGFPELTRDAISQLAAGTAQRIPQSGVAGTYFARRGKGDEWIDWSDTSENIYNKIRALEQPGPGARSMLAGREVTIWRAYYDRGWPRYIGVPGQVVGRSTEGVLVKTGNSTVAIRSIQDEQGIRIPEWTIGTRLESEAVARTRLLEERVAALQACIADRSNAEGSIASL